MVTKGTRYKISKTLKENALFFLKRGIRELNEHTSNNKTTLSIEGAKISYIFLQTSLELAIKAYLIKFEEIDKIIKKKDKNEILNDTVVIERLKANKLRFVNFENLKHIIKRELDDDQFETIKDFQHTRNIILHFNADFVEADLIDFNYDFIYFIVHVLLPILSEFRNDIDTPSALYQGLLDKKDFLNLISLPIYIDRMYFVATEKSKNVYHCPLCWEKAFGIQESKCYCCGYEDLDYIQLGFVNCCGCKAENAMVYDKLNIEINNNIWKNSRCLNCEEKYNVYVCPKCEEAYSFEMESDLAQCQPNLCVNC